jgi:hypothetical protein
METHGKTYTFAVRYSAAHGKGNVFAMRLTLAHGKGDEQTNGVNVRWKKNVCGALQTKAHGKLFVCRAPK